MKANASLRRKSATITKSRWTAYATAGAASALGCASSAEADITYSGLIDYHLTVAPGMSSRAYFQLDQLGHSLLLDLSRQRYSTFGGPASGNAAFVVIAPAAGVAGFVGYNGNYASRLNLGQNILTQPFVSGFGILARPYGDCCYYGSFNQWGEPGINFVGFRFNGGEGLQYGWARINMDGAPGNSFTLIDYAFGDVGDRVTAGQTSISNVPDSGGSLGLLALGCTGLLAWRAARQG